MMNDVSGAFFCAPAKRQVFAELPEEGRVGGQDPVGELNHSMYGTRGAAQNWPEECADTMVGLGFTRGTATPGTLYHKDRDLGTYIHGHGFVTPGTGADLKWLKASIGKHHGLKAEVLGPDPEGKAQVKILDGTASWTGKGLECEAGPGHVGVIIKELGLSNAKGVCSPGTKEEGATKGDKGELLPPDQGYVYLPLVAGLNCLAPGRPDIACSAKGLARTMSKPTTGCLGKLERLARYLVEQPGLVLKYSWQSAPGVVKVYSGAGWAGCRSIRAPTSGGCLVFGGHCIQDMSQAVVAANSMNV